METDRRLATLKPGSADDVRHAGQQVGSFSAAMADADRAIKGFLYPRMYRHERISRIMGDAEGKVATADGEYDLCSRCRGLLAERGYKIPVVPTPPWPKPQ